MDRKTNVTWYNVIMNISIIIPVFREEKNIEKVLSLLAKHVTFSHEILLIYDNDQDPTVAVVKKYIATHKKKHIILVKNNTGIQKGVMNAIKTGFSSAKGKAIVIVMADLADDPTQID